MFYVLSSAVRPDRMRGGRNKFGPLYRRHRQMKQQTTNTAPHRTEMETTQMCFPKSPSDPHLLSSHISEPSSSYAFNVTHVYPSGMGHSSEPVPMDCTMNSHRVLPPSSMPYPGLYCPFPKEKGEMEFSYSPTPTHYHLMHSAPDNSFTPASTPASSPCSTSSSTMALSRVLSQTPASPPSASITPNFLNQLMEGEQDEDLLCTKVLASLQREQANRGKHDRLNTFSIMCKMADQTLFGLVEWARNSNLFKELKVINHVISSPVL